MVKCKLQDPLTWYPQVTFKLLGVANPFFFPETYEP